MFILSQCILHKCSSLTKLETISTYSIILGLIVYSTIYLYILYTNVDYIYIFNKFIIYIVGIDLLLSTFYYSMNASTVDEVSTPLLQENVLESESDDTDTEDFFESAHEDEKDDEMDVDEMEDEHIIEIGEEVSVQEGSELHKEVLGEQGQQENDQFEVNFKPTESLNDTTIEIKEETETLQEHNKVDNVNKVDNLDNVEGKTDENGEVLIKPKKNKRKGRPSKQSVQQI